MRQTGPSHLFGIPAVLCACVVFTLGTLAAAAGQPLVNVNRDGVILDGYDPVAFFTDAKPVKGLAEFTSTYNGAIYWFASNAHQAAFEAAPAKYEPQFGAFCAYAVSQGRTAPIDVNTWSMVEGRLVVQHNARAVKLWNADPPGLLQLADRYWPSVVANGGKQIDVKSVR